MQILLSKVAGFCSNDKIICIKQRGDLKTLFFQNNPERKTITFNLPKGKWVTNSKVKKLKKPLIYICPPIAEPELRREIKPFQFRVADNPSKVTISFAYNNFADIKIDPKIWAQSIPAFLFVMMHENGHNYYGGKDKIKDPDGYYASETKCDIYACNMMLKNGFNPSQCIWGIDLCLSDAGPAQKRKQDVKDWVNQVYVEGGENLESVEVKSRDFVGFPAVANKDGEGINESTGNPVIFKKGEKLGTVESIFGAENSGKVSIDTGSIGIVVNASDLQIPEKAGGKDSETQKGGDGLGILKGDSDKKHPLLGNIGFWILMALLGNAVLRRGSR